ncbi:MAG: hypothetical protein LC745_04725, partial [Planctomycetia bacterium]|nr:hypothetical protein [Planctomycetia bacterium]
ARDARSLAVLKALDVSLAMNFENETPLEDLLKYVKEKTKSSEFPKGLPVYVDPVGLQEAEKTMTSPISIDLDGVPLRRTLHLALKQLGLLYKVDDGMIYITAESSEDAGPLPSAIQEPPPIMVMKRRHERGEMTPEERKAFIEMLKDGREIELLLHRPPSPNAPRGVGGGMGGGLR